MLDLASSSTSGCRRRDSQFAQPVARLKRLVTFRIASDHMPERGYTIISLPKFD